MDSSSSKGRTDEYQSQAGVRGGVRGRAVSRLAGGTAHGQTALTPTTPTTTTTTSGASGTSGGSSSGTSSSGTSSSNSSTSGGTSASTSASGTYTGTTETHRYGSVTVTVTLSNGTITNLNADVVSDGEHRSESINAEAVPMLESEIKSANSADVSTVSGATYTTTAYLESLQSALDQAK